MIDIVGASVDEFSVVVAFEPEVVLLTVAFSVDTSDGVSVPAIAGFFVDVAIDVAGDVPSLVVIDFSVEVTVDGSCDAFSSFIEVDISGTGSVFAIVCSSVEVPNNKSIFYY